ncbi:MAG: hypothetical protein UV05_C0008G0006 [candidate division CPR1 bacterium GW2011_GWA2_42_17]|uniref:DUF2283 domain-containing protein n=1 Tax=candidate division CPR1 bacterium GW2011_GWA2_42_17 TaxID=1618341 RepID=A0A0G0Z6F1_9BACT|nr:MAG: hypothetical protein UV05_C0008G0006 [candidate division CPR1 bacterium GW2011_GWA2_42_17]
MHITYDKKADAMYLYFQKGKKIARTVELADLLIADLDRKGKVIGVEVLCASRQLAGTARSKKMKTGNFFTMDISVPMNA